MIPKRLVKQMACQPDPLSDIVREGEHLAKQRRVRNTQKDLDDLRESVRRLVGDLQDLEEETRPDGWMADLPVNDCLKIALKKFRKAHPELSALIDGKDGET